MNIIRATTHQLADCCLLLDEYFLAIGIGGQETPAELKDLLADSEYAFWITYVDDIPAGCVLLRPLPLIGRAAEFKRLYVRPTFRGLGLANALLDTIEAHAASCSYDWIYLDTRDDLKDALRIYAARGYEPCDRYNDNPDATIFLRKPVTATNARHHKSG